MLDIAKLISIIGIILRSLERFGKPDAHSGQRLRHLKDSRKKLVSLILKSISQGGTVDINSTTEINIE
jgi:hypothetical protein